MTEPAARSGLVPALVYAALSTAIVSSLGMLLVPTISREMDVSVGTAQWMLTINLLVGAVATPVMGRLSDGPHKKRLLLWSLSIILAGSVVAAVAPNFTVFLIGRALQGLTYGIVPVTIALARRYVAADKVRFSISSLSVTVATGIGVGYPLTGIIAGLFDFRFAFWFAALFVVTAILVVFRVVPPGPDEQAPRLPFDYPGAGLLGLGLGALLLGVSEGPNWGWGSPWTIGAFIVAAAVLTAWVRTELRTQHPLINLRVFRNGEVLLANGTAIGLGAAMYIGLSISSLVAQAPASTGYGIALPVLWAGFVMFPLSVGSFSANRLVRRLSHRIRLATLLPIGAGMMAAAGMLLWFAHDRALGDPDRDAGLRSGNGNELCRHAGADRPQRGHRRAGQFRELQPGPAHRGKLLRHRRLGRRARGAHGAGPSPDRRRNQHDVRDRRTPLRRGVQLPAHPHPDYAFPPGS